MSVPETITRVITDFPDDRYGNKNGGIDDNFFSFLKVLAGLRLKFFVQLFARQPGTSYRSRPTNSNQTYTHLDVPKFERTSTTLNSHLFQHQPGTSHITSYSSCTYSTDSLLTPSSKTLRATLRRTLQLTNRRLLHCHTFRITARSVFFDPKSSGWTTLMEETRRSPRVCATWQSWASVENVRAWRPPGPQRTDFIR